LVKLAEANRSAAPQLVDLLRTANASYSEMACDTVNDNVAGTSYYHLTSVFERAADQIAGEVGDAGQSIHTRHAERLELLREELRKWVGPETCSLTQLNALLWACGVSPDVLTDILKLVLEHAADAAESAMECGPQAAKAHAVLRVLECYKAAIAPWRE